MSAAVTEGLTTGDQQTTTGMGGLWSVRDAPLGGQAVIEGVMMRGPSRWAVAIRAPLPEQVAERPLQQGEIARGEITVLSEPLPQTLLQRHRALRIPVVRGVLALGSSLRLGFRALNHSVDVRQPPGTPPTSAGAWFGAIVLALALAIGLFFVVPVALTSLIKGWLGAAWLFWLVEGVVRTVIFIGYLVLVARLPDLRRVFEYHGAEHQTISCYEAGLPLTPQNAARFSRLHPRCGTSFLLVVMIVAIFAFAPIGLPSWYWLVLTRIVGVPVVAGIAYEIIRWAGRQRGNRIVRAVMWPGLQLQRLTTRAPNAEQLAVAIAALEAVLAAEDLHSGAAAEFDLAA